VISLKLRSAMPTLLLLTTIISLYSVVARASIR